MKVWHVRPEQAIIPTLLPWISESMEESTYLRCPEDEGTVLLVNLPTCGVVPSMKRNYFIYYPHHGPHGVDAYEWRCHRDPRQSSCLQVVFALVKHF